VDLTEADCGIDVRTHWYYRTKHRPLNRYFAEASAPAAAMPRSAGGTAPVA